MSSAVHHALVLATDRISAALAIHRPCHRRSGCERSHTDPAEIPECIGCGYDNHDQPVTYPCSTALALGIPAPSEEPAQ